MRPSLRFGGPCKVQFPPAPATQSGMSRDLPACPVIAQCYARRDGAHEVPVIPLQEIIAFKKY